MGAGTHRAEQAAQEEHEKGLNLKVTPSLDPIRFLFLKSKLWMRRFGKSLKILGQFCFPFSGWQGQLSLLSRISGQIIFLSSDSTERSNLPKMELFPSQPVRNSPVWFEIEPVHVLTILLPFALCPLWMQPEVQPSWTSNNLNYWSYSSFLPGAGIAGPEGSTKTGMKQNMTC